MSNIKTKYHCGNTNCKQVISVSEVRFPVVNDAGGVVFTCESCELKQAVRMLNPVESYYNLKGGKPIDKWVDYEEENVLAKNSLTVVDLINTPGLRYELPERDPLKWPGTDIPLYEHNGLNFDYSAYAALGMLEDQVNDHYKTYLNGWYVKRHPCDRTFVVLETEFDEEVQRVIFSKDVSTERDLNANNLLLVHHSGCDIIDHVDGIYSKTDCLNFLKKLLIRWKQLADAVLIVVPFVGYPFTGSEAKNLELWNVLNTHTDSSKTEMVTRSAAFRLFKKATDQLDVPFTTLQEWDFLTDMTKVLSSADNDFLERSHAKFYTGIFQDRVEVLSGSFNIHNGGPSLENISLKVYEKEKFRVRYLDKVRPNFAYPDSESGMAHYMVFRGGSFKTENVTTYKEFRDEFFSI